ncbi:hypothetical protein sos41_10770 [Alphaproteobacteria bacterium SO-S41]|nr:hypothetical protein sos41_10770 [Alphaproteobacteria bacterium SO-S41]
MTDPDKDIEDAEDTFEETLDTAESWIEQKLVDVRNSARDEPIKTLAIAAAIGAVIGAIFLR